MIKTFFLKSVRLYQKFISPILGQNCRFYPTCSEYVCKSIEKYRPIEGFKRGMKRILKCHPWHAGGIDLP